MYVGIMYYVAQPRQPASRVDSTSIETMATTQWRNLWLVKIDGLILQPMACTNHKFHAMPSLTIVSA